MNPFDLSGPEFLVLYAIVAIGGFAVAALLRVLIGRSRLGSSSPAVELDVYEIAYLAGGAERAADAALGALVHRKVLELDPVEGTVRRTTTSLSMGTSRFEAEIADGLQDIADAHPERACAGWAARDLAAGLAFGLRDKLIALGLTPSDAAQKKLRLWQIAVVVAVVLFGVLKIAVGLSRGRPVEILLALVLATTCLGFTLFPRPPPQRTRAGDHVLKSLTQENAALQMAGLPLSPNDLALAVALFGRSQLPAFMRNAFASIWFGAKGGSGGGGWHFGSSCGSSCGGGCGGGCGGCGSS